MSILKGINVISLSVTDLDGARTFYSSVLGLGQPSYDNAEIGWIEWGGEGETHLAVTPLGEGRAIGHSTVVVFNVDDCHAAVAQLRSQGVKCDDPVGIPGVVTYATFYDPFGNGLQLAGPPPAA